MKKVLRNVNPVKKLSIQGRDILINGKETWLIAGEIHYFRLDQKEWEDRLNKLIESGCNAVAFYVPWFVHEPEEGIFDFTGNIDEKNNLAGWLDLIKRKGLLAIVRPGPYVYAEMTNAGIPNWFVQNYPQAKAVRWTGKEFDSKFFVSGHLSYLHPVFLQKVDRWYKGVSDVLRGSLNVNGGPVCFVQLCNEIPGIQIWEGVKDANPETLGLGHEDGLYAAFLKNKYKKIEALNQAYGKTFKNFSEITLPNPDSKNEIVQNNDWDEFYFGFYLSRYLEILCRMLRKYGISANLSINPAGARDMLLLHEACLKNPEVITGIDCYYGTTFGPAEISYQLEFGHEVLRELYEGPPIIWEFQSGQIPHYPSPDPRHLYVWIVLAFINGYKGMNLYMFAGGANRPGLGIFGADHDWQAPVSSKGGLRESYFSIQKALMDISEHPWILQTEKEIDIGLGIYNRQSLKGGPHSKLLRETRDLVQMFFLNNTAYRVLDIKHRTVKELLKFSQCLWLIGEEFMDIENQEKLKNYIEAGGNLVLQGMIPQMDLAGHNVSVLQELAEVRLLPPSAVKDKTSYGRVFLSDAMEQVPYGRVVIDGVEIYTEVQPAIVEMDGEVLARTLRGEPSIVSKKIGIGSLTIIPFHLVFQLQSQLTIIKKILNYLGVKQAINAERLHGILRKDPKGNEEAFFLNYRPEVVREDVMVRDTKKRIELKPFTFTTILLNKNTK